MIAFVGFGQCRAVAGQGHAQGFAQAVHAVGGEHAGTRAAGGAGVVFDLLQPLSSHLACFVCAHAFKYGDQVDDLSICCFPGSHWSARDEDGGDVNAHRGHQHAGNDFVAVGDADHAVKLWASIIVSTQVGDQFAGGQGIFHAGVAHGDTVIDGDGVEFKRYAAWRGWPL